MTVNELTQPASESELDEFGTPRGALAGIRVLDLSRMMSGPLCGRMLADLGAEVIKVEPPEGDATRGVPPLVGGFSPYYAQLNAGKRTVCLDLKAPGGPDIISRLAAASDVLVENFRPGVLARYGLDACTLRTDNPRLVYCSVSGWGQDGPWASRQAYAPVVHAEVGILERSGRLRDRRPEPELHQHGDAYPALLACSAVLAALFERTTTGKGRHLDVAMGEGMFYVNEWSAVDLQDDREERGIFDTSTHRVFELGDGTCVALIGDPARVFPFWLRSLGGDEALLEDIRFATEEARRRNFEQVIDELNALTVRFPDYDGLAAVFAPPMLVAKVRSVKDLAETDWARHRGLTTEVAPGLSVPSAPWRVAGSRVGVAGPVSALGEHNREVLADVAGFTAAEIDHFTATGVLRS